MLESAQLGAKPSLRKVISRCIEEQNKYLQKRKDKYSESGKEKSSALLLKLRLGSKNDKMMPRCKKMIWCSVGRNFSGTYIGARIVVHFHKWEMYVIIPHLIRGYNAPHPNTIYISDFQYNMINTGERRFAP